MADGRYVAPIQLGKSYADMLKEQMSEISKQQQANLTSQIARRDANNALKYEQLKTIYGFDMQGWSPQAIDAFGKLQSEAARRMKNLEYDSVEELVADSSKLRGLHASLNNHFTETKNQLLETAKYVDNPGLYPDKSSTIIDTRDTLFAKKRYADTLGYEGTWGVDLNNLDITIPQIGLDGSTIGEGTESILTHPHLGDPSILAPTTRPLGGITPESFASEYYSAVDRYVDDGKSIDQAKTLVRRAMMDEITSEDANPQAKNEAAMLYYQMYNGKTHYKSSDEVLTPEENYVNEAMRYISSTVDASTLRTTADERKQQARLNQLMGSRVNYEVKPKELDPYFTGPPEADLVRVVKYDTPDLKTPINLNRYSDKLYSSDVNELDQVAGLSVDGAPTIDLQFDSIHFVSDGSVVLKGLVNTTDKSTQMPDQLLIPASDQDTISVLASILQTEYGPQATLENLRKGFPQQNTSFGDIKFN